MGYSLLNQLINYRFTSEHTHPTSMSVFHISMANWFPLTGSKQIFLHTNHVNILKEYFWQKDESFQNIHIFTVTTIIDNEHGHCSV